MGSLLWLAACLAWTATPAYGQLPATPKYDQVIKGKLGDGFQVSMKQNSVCETTPGVKSYSGYITTPPSANLPVTANNFFWFFESRKDPANAPFTIFVGGGPGFGSMSSAVADIGPCQVNADSNSTTLNPWSFNNESNLLFIDQPVQTGFSYDAVVNATLDQLDASGLSPMPLPPGAAIPPSNATFSAGAYPSQDPRRTANSTRDAAAVFWQDVQTWFHAFPQYRPKSGLLNLWTESYGGRYAPLFAAHFKAQNALIRRGQLCDAEAFDFDTVGIGNGWIDVVSHAQSYLPFAVNNTYGIKLVNDTVLAALDKNLTASGHGCLAQILHCQAEAARSQAEDPAVDSLCSAAFLYCQTIQSAPTALKGRANDDITQPGRLPMPPSYYVGFFAQGWVMDALGAAVNYSDNAHAPLAAFVSTGDLARTGQLEAIGSLLDAGTHVTLTYGDRDYQVNWFGGENATAHIPWVGQHAWSKAGYADLDLGLANGYGGVAGGNVTGASDAGSNANLDANANYGGKVRQVGRLAFVRAYQGGHTVARTRPETMFRVFQRTLAHQDIQLGKVKVEMHDGWTLATTGPASVRDVASTVPPFEKPVCYTLTAAAVCSPDQLKLLASGKGVVKNFVLQE